MTPTLCSVPFIKKENLSSVFFLYSTSLFVGISRYLLRRSGCWNNTSNSAWAKEEIKSSALLVFFSIFFSSLPFFLFVSTQRARRHTKKNTRLPKKNRNSGSPRLLVPFYSVPKRRLRLSSGLSVHPAPFSSGSRNNKHLATVEEKETWPVLHDNVSIIGTRVPLSSRGRRLEALGVLVNVQCNHRLISRPRIALPLSLI